MTVDHGGTGMLSLDRAVDWQPAPHRPRLQRGGLDLWLIDLAAQADVATLGRQEIARLKHFARPISRQRYLCSRQAMRDILARYLELAPAQVPIVVREGGKPELVGQDDGLHFNLSHAGDVGLLAISRAIPVGVDIERVRLLKDPRAMAERFLPATLSTELVENPADRRQPFFAMWTRFEACQKAFGLGVFAPRVDFERLCWRHFVPVQGKVACVALACADDYLDTIRFFSHAYDSSTESGIKPGWTFPRP